MRIWQKLASVIVVTLGLISNASAENFKLKYSSNYLMPAYINFNNGGGQYNIQAKINVPLYNIVFSAKGTEKNEQFHMLSYRDTRNGKTYAMAEIDSKTVKYGKVKEPLKEEALTMPTYDLFTTAFQLSYYDKLPSSFQTTNGKKLYPTPNVQLRKAQKEVKVGGKTYQEITYKFRTSDKKDITVKKFEGEKFPRYIAYSRDGDNYELTFDSFVK
ncbi:TPA: hypothetical protein PXF07_000124 [Mannheimia haemolytica]|uniref:Uncharacterized protein n=1 Tax=Mannheimia haemolytica TaxID=75985 RepID=Q06PX3_MANHA|nr:hypothetical protein [Mannheimia haemolytica]AWW70747.1 hypothetical protein C4O86_02630 [Pasteurellaceae bacterium 12565]ABG89194.1 hypothetical protein mh2546 [Mannheimia haemolytica]AGI31828.2 hypothetical protein D650_5580 [Mannheimia haemolytica USDA-ARS-USMARC-183]AGI36066.2 hypothetical protein D648_20630 [Mannheimia haemolytica USDA-ARS-USMARC-185]AGK00535.1 hypothetical protein MHH_c00240 [Mannheimia haemolytica M42548]